MKHIPNILSKFRIVMIPFYLIAIFNEDKLGAGLILIVSGITDLLDGFLARQFNWMSEIGKLLDPLADKLTQTAISLSFIFLIQELNTTVTPCSARIPTSSPVSALSIMEWPGTVQACGMMVRSPRNPMSRR